MSGPAAHALFSASGAEGWMLCGPKLAAEQGQEDSTSEYAAEGTAAHELASWCLETVVKQAVLVKDLTDPQPWLADGAKASDYLGHGIEADGYHFEVDQDMADHVQKYIDATRDRIAEFYLRGAVSVQLLVEVRVDYSRYLGVPDSFGTSDTILLVEWTDDVWQIDVGDLKYGMGVRVYASSRIVGEPDKDWRAEGNKQMLMYALGALDQYSMLFDATLFSMTIYQPRLDHIDSFECDLDTLMRFASDAKIAAEKAMSFIAIVNDHGLGAIANEHFTPGEKQCRWCRIGGSCEARAEKNLATLAGDFDNLDEALPAIGVDAAAGLDQTVIAEVVTKGAEIVHVGNVQLLDALYPSLDEIDNWVKAVRGEIEKRALAGETFSTCKLVQGKRGARTWTDAAEAEKLMKGMRLKVDQMYTFKLITPTVADKLLADQPKRWAKLKAIVGQSDGALSVASINDKRAAVVITPPADDFEDLGVTAGAEPAFDDLV